MDDLIEALQILRKYGNPKYPTFCNDKQMTIDGISPSIVSSEDKYRLYYLGFDVVADNHGEEFVSFKFGG